jgi:hypothetical protein
MLDKSSSEIVNPCHIDPTAQQLLERALLLLALELQVPRQVFTALFLLSFEFKTCLIHLCF